MSAKWKHSEDWLESLFIKRVMGRRILPESLPPYVTGDGLVAIDRRHQEDRRKPIARPGILLQDQVRQPPCPFIQ